MRRITVSCPGCGEEFARVPLDEAESILFNGCPDCRRKRPRGDDRPLRVQVTAEDVDGEPATAEGIPDEEGAPGREVGEGASAHE